MIRSLLSLPGRLTPSSLSFSLSLSPGLCLSVFLGPREREEDAAVRVMDGGGRLTCSAHERPQSPHPHHQPEQRREKRFPDDSTPASSHQKENLHPLQLLGIGKLAGSDLSNYIRPINPSAGCLQANAAATLYCKNAVFFKRFRNT